MRVQALRYLLLDAIERTATDEKDMFRIHGNHLLVGMFAATLGRYINNRALKQLEQALLHTLAADIAGNRGVVALAGNLVNLVNEHNTALGLLYVVVGNLQKTCQNTLDILAHITGLCKHCCINYRKRHLQKLGNGTCQQSLARTRAAHHYDIALLNLDIIGSTALHKSFIVVVHRNRKGAFSLILPNDILVKECLYLLWLGKFLHFEVILRQESLLAQDIMRLLHTVIAYITGHSGHEQCHLILGPATETATFFSFVSHQRYQILRVSTLSIIPYS